MDSQMDSGQSVRTLRRAWATFLLVVHWWLVLTYLVAHIKKRKHIAILQRGMVILVSENLAWLIITVCYFSREWAITIPPGSPPYDASVWVNLASAIWPGIGAVVSYTRAYTVLVKFTKMPAACRLVEVRTTQGQLAFAFLAFFITMVYWGTLDAWGPHLCINICHEANVIFQAHYLLAAPYNVVYNLILNATVKKCVAVGATEETAGILKELERLGKFLSLTMVSQVIFIIIMDNGGIPYNEAVTFFLYNYTMMQMFGLWIVLNVEPSVRHGYCPFPVLVRVFGPRLGAQVAPEELLLADDQCTFKDVEHAMLGSPASTPASSPPASPAPLVSARLQASGGQDDSQAQGLSSSRRGLTPQGSARRLSTPGGQGADSEGGRASDQSARRSSSGSNPKQRRRSSKGSESGFDLGTTPLLQGEGAALLSDPGKLEELWVMARKMLCEEAVRCMVHIMRLRSLGDSAQDKEITRELYHTIIREHLDVGAIMPVDVSPWLRNEMIRVLQVSARRRIIFRDDRDRTLKALEPLLDLLSPRANPVLSRFYVQAYGVGRGHGRARKGSESVSAEPPTARRATGEPVTGSPSEPAASTLSPRGM